MKVKFTKYKRRPNDKDFATDAAGDPLYRLSIDGEPVRDGLTLDEVVEAINRRDEETMRPLQAAEGGGCL